MGQVIGVLGGMGAAATVDFYDKVTSHVHADRDQDHPQILIYSHAKVPDRTEFLVGEGEDPTPALVEGARLLKNAGADFLAVPCNTAHVFMDAVCQEVGIRLVSMIEAVADELATAFPHVTNVGLVATTGTLVTGLYRQTLEERGLTLLQPSEGIQVEKAMPAIKMLKGGDTGSKPRRLVEEVVACLVEAGAQVVIAACTEIPLVLSGDNSPVPIIDTTEVLARRVLREAGVPCR